MDAIAAELRTLGRPQPYERIGLPGGDYHGVGRTATSLYLPVLMPLQWQKASACQGQKAAR
jgi:hypothetical protein